MKGRKKYTNVAVCLAPVSQQYTWIRCLCQQPAVALQHVHHQHQHWLNVHVALPVLACCLQVLFCMMVINAWPVNTALACMILIVIEDTNDFGLMSCMQLLPKPCLCPCQCSPRLLLLLPLCLVPSWHPLHTVPSCKVLRCSSRSSCCTSKPARQTSMIGCITGRASCKQQPLLTTLHVHVQVNTNSSCYSTCGRYWQSWCCCNKTSRLTCRTVLSYSD